ncbi:hypothetical protein DSAG12_01920 [Promethearchaeum syntrophicum]|uniref:Uncharacterized protein n=1 Tax=Promethearchaeum syntrophicum TaxID=2594042 RepID=A0A5B9DAH3_9ARCH|nr:hypothetical protein [Candidatus Prometheoarchaeum syntrophicum]QEE16092.1 Translocon-associated protein beta (TRAPB) [Candidatus Prometheoarchaeum syntrophicum]
MKKITKYTFIILLGMILLWNHPIQSVNAQGEDNYTKEYDEDLNIYISKNGDVIYHWDITDQGMFVDFPVNLTAPNSTTSAIEDVDVVLSVYQSTPKPQEMGIYASENGGYFESDLPGNDWEYSFSHLSLEIEVDFDNYQNLSLGKTWLDSLVSQLETTLNVDFLQYENSSYPWSTEWNCQFRAFPQDYETIWDSILTPFPCGNTTLLSKDKILESPNKAISIDANWDDENSEFRWEYEVDLELYRENLVNIGKESENTINFNEILGYEGNFQMPTWVNDSTLNIFLYKGAEISSVTPSLSDEIQDRCHIERELHFEGDMHGYLPDDANFVFRDGRESQPILNCIYSLDDTTVNYGEEINVTATFTNVGGQTAYDIDIIHPDINNYNFTIEDLIINIESLEPGETSTISTLYISDTHNDNTPVYQMQYYYDATSNLDLANHWSRPQFSDDRFYGTSNRIKIFNNDADPEPWMVLQYNIDNIGPQVGENVNISAVITNIGDVFASDIKWDFNPTQNYGYFNELGVNLTNDSGIIERLNSSDSVNVSAIYTVDAYNRYFGGNSGYSCNLEFYSEEIEDGEDSILMNSNDAGFSIYLIYPREDQKFGPILIFKQEISAPSSEAGSIITIESTISNIGTTPAYNVYTQASYYETYGIDEYFYLEYLEGIGPEFSIGTLYPGESLNYRTRFTLLKNLSIENISITPYISYSARRDSQICFLTPNQISEGNTKLSGESIWMIVAITAVVVIIGESFMFYKKIKV